MLPACAMTTALRWQRQAALLAAVLVSARLLPFPFPPLGLGRMPVQVYLGTQEAGRSWPCVDPMELSQHRHRQMLLVAVPVLSVSARMLQRAVPPLDARQTCEALLRRLSAAAHLEQHRCLALRHLLLRVDSSALPCGCEWPCIAAPRRKPLRGGG